MQQARFSVMTISGVGPQGREAEAVWRTGSLEEGGQGTEGTRFWRITHVLLKEKVVTAVLRRHWEPAPSRNEESEDDLEATVRSKEDPCPPPGPVVGGRGEETAT